jgi:hypothetical protein
VGDFDEAEFFFVSHYDFLQLLHCSFKNQLF